MSKQIDDMIELFQLIERFNDMEEFFKITAEYAGTSPTDKELMSKALGRMRAKLNNKIKEQTEKIIKKD